MQHLENKSIPYMIGSDQISPSPPFIIFQRGGLLFTRMQSVDIPLFHWPSNQGSSTYKGLKIVGSIHS